MSRSSHRKTEQCLEGRNEHGFTLIELLIVVAIIGIRAAIALMLYQNIQARAGIAKAPADTPTLAYGLTMYLGQCRAFPPSGAETPGGQCNGSGLSTVSLSQQNALGQAVGPFLSPVPSAATGWTPYTAGYVANLTAGTYRISTSGDSVVGSVP